MSQAKLVLLGVGQVASSVAKLVRQPSQIYGTTRSATKARELLEHGINPVLIAPWTENASDSLCELCTDAHVLASFPPDGEYDKQFAVLCKEAKSIIYISSTGVYGEISGMIDESTDVDPSNPTALARLKAERIWAESGATILRVPGIYSPQSGLHKRLLAGTYRLPGNGENFSSRIHLHDLARIINTAFDPPIEPRSIYVVGDLEPSTHKEVVTFLCNHLGIPFPSSMSIQDVSLTLRGNRRISSKKVLRDLGVDLAFPTYREGYAHCLRTMDRSMAR
jgi:hypothetical protein